MSDGSWCVDSISASGNIAASGNTVQSWQPGGFGFMLIAIPGAEGQCPADDGACDHKASVLATEAIVDFGWTVTVRGSSPVDGEHHTNQQD